MTHRRRSRPVRFLAACIAAALIVAIVVRMPVRADEGMWTFDNFPVHTVQRAYDFTPSHSWLEHVERASLRIAGGCSASFISPHGLIMTNHHCVVGCVQQLSTPEKNYVATGYTAKTSADERPCPDFEIDQLTSIQTVTPQIRAAVGSKHGSAANAALHAVEAALQKTCGSSADVRCDVVSLYHGGVYDLYHYKRYNDVRLVFAPEYAVAQFGGDPDNFNFPRFDFDIGILRAYEHGKPVTGNDYFPWSLHGSRAAELVFVSGNPGGTSRELTVSQLAFERDHYAHGAEQVAEIRGQLEEFIARGPEQAREADEELFGLSNYQKAIEGREAALLDPKFFGAKERAERQLRAKVAADPRLAAADGSAWSDLARVQTERAQLITRYEALNNYSLSSGLLGNATRIVRAAAERKLPNGQRLPEYTDQSLVELKQRLAAPIPTYRDLEELNLAGAFTFIRRDLGTDDPFVKAMLGAESPEQLAHRLVTTTKLTEPSVRLALYNGGAAAVAASTDPMIVFAKRIDGDRRAIRKTYEARVDAPTRAAAERIAKARFAKYGTSVDPDATFTARLSYGAVKGFSDLQGRTFAPYTTIGGLFARANGAPPYALPSTWLQAKPALDLATPMNLSTTNDIIGGNSGSPLIDRDARIIGLIFDGNIFSLGGDYGYDATRNRSVAVDSRALLAGLRTVYGFDRIVDEITAAMR